MPNRAAGLIEAVKFYILTTARIRELAINLLILLAE